MSELSFKPDINRTGQEVPAHWNHTEQDYRFDRTVPELFEAQLAKTPEAVAIVFQGQSLTFEQLNQRANQCAHYLLAQGVGRNTLVAVCMDRSLELEIALLGILKAGAGYLPLDPSHPQGRLEFILQESKPHMILAQQRYHELFSDSGKSVFPMDGETERLDALTSTNPDTMIQGHDLAYVIYTSGSTGRPKGVMIEHRALLNQLLWMQETFALTADDRVLQKSPYCFDMSVWELFGPLVAGARLVMASPDGHKDPQYIVDTIQSEGITTIHFVPSMFDIFLEHPRCTDCPSLKRVFCGGEALPGRLIDRFYQLFSETSLYNTYGPTETTITASWWDCRRHDPKEPVPIGQPVANTQIYIVDPQNHPVPIGVAGELCIGGVQLARGYLNRPDLTRSQFIANPFDPSSDTRLYRTGDLCRYRSDGNIDFLGRLDHQVKIRGFRIECGEIEAALAKYPEIRKTVVVAREDLPGDKQLVAYLVGSGQQHPTDLDLQEHLRTYLPAYMIPKIFVFLKDIPLSSNGKVDRKALPLPVPQREDIPCSEHRDPLTDLQKTVRQLFCDVLDRPHISRDANFFHLGGHSLLAAKLTYRIQSVYPVPITIKEIFQYPTVESLSEWIETTIQMDLPQPERLAIPSVSCEKLRRLSFSQQSLWFLYELNPYSAFYNVPFRLNLAGPLNMPALEQSLATIIERHEILRTNFLCQDGEPLQFVRPAATGLLTCHDCDSEAEAEEHLTSLVRQPFDLAKDLLIRCHLYSVGVDEHIVLVVMHHIVTDGASVRLFLEELSTLYHAHVKGLETSLASLPNQYADYAQWQRDQLDTPEYDTQWQYWQKQLADLKPTELPTDAVRPRLQSHCGSTESLHINGALKKALYALTYQQDTTLFVTLLAACKILLYRYTDKTDLAVGTPTANRTREDLEALMGFFVNTVVIRTKFTEDSSFLDVLQQVHTRCLEAQTHQSFPFEQLVNRLQTERDLSRDPLFQIMFLVQQDVDTMVTMEDMTVQYQNIATDTSKFDLCFIVEQTAEKLILKIEYNTDLYKQETVRRLLEHYKTLIAGVVADPNSRITDLPLLTEIEWQTHLQRWGRNPRDYPRTQCVHELFEDQAETTPHAVALSMNDESLSYQQLNARANQWAHYLRKYNVSTGERVGISMRRCPDLLVAMLAILKAGGCYVPLDRSFPQARLQLIIDETQPRLILTHTPAHLNVPGVPAICMDGEDIMKEVADQSDDTMGVVSTPDQLAYIMYTSGSTGRPKGVAIKHRGIVRLLFGIDYVDLSGQQVFLQLAPAGFDASTFEIWGALLHGHRCILYPDDVPDLDRLGALLQQHRVSCLWLTASLFNLIIDEKPEILEGVSQLITGGEALSVDHVRRAMQKLPRTQLVNGYGPTESTTFACCYRIPGNLPETTTHIPIGRPIANTTCVILDAHHNPVPIGIPGELHIGGDGLAEGYVGQPDLTAERFIKNPLDATGQTRLYKTGDICQWMPDGLIAFVGRLDDQVKIRGFRIELREIDTTLISHPAIQRAVTILHENAPHQKYLASYCVASPDTVAPAVDQVIAYLKSTLPDYMIPSTLTWIDQIPLTPNGKVDLRALPKPPDTEQTHASDQEVRTATEEQLIPLFQEVLKCEYIQPHSHFFKLGGHSLLAVKLFHRIQQTFNKKLPLATLFQAPTIRQLAQVIDHSAETVSHTSLVKLKDGKSAHPIFILPGLGGHSLSFSHLAERLDTDRSIYGLELKGLDGQQQPHSRIEDMARYFLDLIRSLDREGPYTLIGYSLGGQIAYEMACQLTREGRRLEALVILCATAPGYAKTSKYRLIRYAYRTRDFIMLPLRRKVHYLCFKTIDIKNRLVHWYTCQFAPTLQSTPQSDFRRIVKDVSKHAMHALYTYKPHTSYRGDILLIRNTGLDSPLTRINLHSYSGWDRYVTGSIEKHDIPCGHIEILQDHYVDQMISPLRRYLAQLETAKSNPAGDPVVWTPVTEIPNLESSRVDLYWVQTSQHRHHLDDLKEYLTQAEMDRARAYRQDLHRERFITRRALLRQILATYTGQPAREVPLTASDSGKPMLAADENPADLRFSLSHREDGILYAFTRQREIGVDLEFLTCDPELPELARNHFSKPEYQALCRLPDDQQSRRFYALWTCKEAYLKARGIIPLETFTVTIDSREGPRLAVDDPDPIQVDRWRFHQFRVNPDYLGALVVPAGDAVKLKFWTLEHAPKFP